MSTEKPSLASWQKLNISELMDLIEEDFKHDWLTGFDLNRRADRIRKLAAEQTAEKLKAATPNHPSEIEAHSLLVEPRVTSVRHSIAKPERHQECIREWPSQPSDKSPYATETQSSHPSGSRERFRMSSPDDCPRCGLYLWSQDDCVCGWERDPVCVHGKRPLEDDCFLEDEV